MWACAAALVVGFSNISLSADTAAALAGGAADIPHSIAPSRAGHTNVLIVTGVQHGLPVTESMIAATAAGLQSKGLSVKDIYVEYLDLARNVDPQGRAALASMLRHKLPKTDLGLVIVLSETALEFMENEGRDLIGPDTPVLVSLVQQSQVDLDSAQRSIVSVVGQPDVAGTLGYGLALFPRTERVVVVTGTGDEQSQVFEPAAEALATMPYETRLEDTRTLNYGEMLERVSSLPADSIILLGSYFKDRTGRSFVPVEVVAEVAKQANAPVFVL